MSNLTLRIGEREFSKVDPGVFQVPVSDLGSLPMGRVPAHSTIEIIDLPPSSDYEFSIRVTNGGEPGDDEYLTIFGYIGCVDGPEVDDRMSRLRRAILPFVELSELPDPIAFPIKMDGRLTKGAGFSIDCEGRPEVVISEAIQPLLRLYHGVNGPIGLVFLCHASEDRSDAFKLANLLQSHGVAVWLDQWEIRVGESIVQKINSGLAASSHLAILLSRNSVSKPWVAKEISAALMRNLADKSIFVLPVRLDDAPLPAILADIRYADCRVNFEKGFKEVLDAVRASNTQHLQERPYNSSPTGVQKLTEPEGILLSKELRSLAATREFTGEFLELIRRSFSHLFFPDLRFERGPLEGRLVFRLTPLNQAWLHVRSRYGTDYILVLAINDRPKLPDVAAFGAFLESRSCKFGVIACSAFPQNNPGVLRYRKDLLRVHGTFIFLIGKEFLQELLEMPVATERDEAFFKRIRSVELDIIHGR